jgi:hypothetical protein
VPDLSHLWQRFLLASTLLLGLLLGVAATVFGYSNTAPVNVGWSIFHINGIPLWTVAIVPLALVLVTGTLYHWFNSLHHFTEHMRHRHRVHELEAEVTSLRAHLDQLLEMPDHSASRVSGNRVAIELVPMEPVAETPVAALPEAVASNGGDKAPKKSRKRVALPMNGEEATETLPSAEPTPET